VADASVEAGAAEEVFVFPLSFGQERLWFMDQVLPENPLFNLNIPLRLRQRLNPSIPTRALNEIVRRHESLRTRIAIMDGRPVQLVSATLKHALPVIDLRRLPAADREREASRLANEEAQRPFDLARGPLLRTTLLQLREDDFVLLVTMHHIISDGWSLGIFWNELSAIWAAFAAGKPSPLPEPSIQYGDFAVWQREWLRGPVLEEQLAFWRAKLRDAPTLQFPADFPRPVVQTFSGALHPLALSVELTDGLRNLAQLAGTTLFMTLLAGFEALLHRYSGQEDIVTGTYIAGRNRAEAEGVIGFFLNSLVLRLDAAGDPTFREVLARVRATTLEAYSHQDVPFEKLVEELQPERDLGRNPFFQVMFQLLNVPTLSRFEQGEKPELLKTQRGTAVFDISCMLAESAGGLDGHLEFNTDLFKPETIAQMGRHFEALLAAAVSNPDCRLSELPMLSSAERKAMLQISRGEVVTLPNGESVVVLFEEQAARHGEQTALIFGEETRSFKQINEQANRLARILQKLGVGCETLVGICLERSFDLYALLAVFKAGGAYLPLDPTYPSERLLFMLRDSGARVLVTREKFMPLFKDYTGKLVSLDAVAAELDASDRANLPCATTPGNLAYAIYTSGSTGQPKGVAVAHRQLLNRFAWMWRTHPFSDGEVGCQKTALGFVDSIWEIFGPLLRGVPIVIVPDAEVKDPPALVRTLSRHRVTRIWLVPALLRVILHAHRNLQRRLPSLKMWVSSGEPLSAEMAQEFAAAMPHARLYNLYGTSEVWDVTWHEVTACDGPRVPIGRPIDGMQAYVLDRHRQPQPPGVVGDLYVGGVGLSRGYINRAELNAQRFVCDPFSDDPNARLYKTGDLAAWLADGTIDLLGRADQQTKIRGFRIEPGEIESLLMQTPGVRQAVVVPREDASGEHRLVAYFTSEHGEKPSQAKLRQFLRSKLPEPMIPVRFVRLAEFPLTASGKIDKRQLPSPNGQLVEESRGFIPPENMMEQKIATLWRDVLRRDEIGIDDNFFDLGGHSLLVYQIFAKLRLDVDKPLAITDLFHYPTVRSLAKFCEEPTSKLRRKKKSRVTA
jgi:amino acid adenylation domain-containing protein